MYGGGGNVKIKVEVEPDDSLGAVSRLIVSVSRLNCLFAKGMKSQKTLSAMRSMLSTNQEELDEVLRDARCVASALRDIAHLKVESCIPADG